MFQVVSNYYNRNVITSFTLNEFIQSIKNPDFFRKSQIDLARKIYKESPLKKDDPLYKSIKGSLPCITFLNTFKDSVKNEDIVGKTGFMYFDIDRVSNINLEKFPFVVAYWKSLSNDGYGILIKCSNTSDELLDNVEDMSELLGINLDRQASSKDRLNVMSYDTDLYFNPNYTNYDFKSKNKVSIANIDKSHNRLSAIDSSGLSKLRFSNLDEIIQNYDFQGQDFVVLDTKIEYAEVFVPKNIFEGNRNKSMFVICSQIRGLNTWISYDELLKVCSVINEDKFNPKIDFKELSTIVRKVFENKNPLVILNKTRKILYNPKSNLSSKAKKSINGKNSGKLRRESADLKIHKCIQEWDVDVDGKITLFKIAQKTKLGEATLKRRGKDLKEFIQKINEKFAQLEKN